MIRRRHQANSHGKNELSGVPVSPAVPILPSWAPADLQEILQTLLEQLNHLVEYDACAVLMLVEESLQIAASRGFPASLEFGKRLFDLETGLRPGNLWREGRTIVTDHGLAETPLATLAELVGLGACIQAPLVYHGRPVGLLLLLKDEPGRYTPRDVRAATAFANQAGMAIENARLYAETRRRALHLEAARQVSQTVISILEIDQLLAEVARLIHDRLGHYHVHLFLVDGDSQEIVLRESSGFADESLKRRGLRLKIGVEGITGWVAKTGEPMLCNDVSQEPRYHPHELLPQTRAELAVPLRVGDAVVGVLDVQSERRNAFQHDDLTALQILADQVAIAIENAHLFDRTHRQMKAMRALHDISLDITSHLDTPEVLAAILEQATHFLGAQASSLGILDSQAGVVRLIAVHNLPQEYQGVGLALGEGATGYVVATGAPLIVNEYYQWANRSPIFQPGPYDAILSVPMRRGGEVFGALTVVDSRERRSFHDEDAQLLSLFADLACIALKNAELYGQVRQGQAELEHKVEQRTWELDRAREELTHKAAELRALLRLTVHVQEEERARIARDLHDGSNQLVTGTLYEIQAAFESLVNQRPEVALQKLEIAKGLLRDIEAENRRIISGLHPPILDAQGLVPALKWHAAGFQKLYGVTCSVQVSGQPARRPSETEVAIYRIVQEALNNVAAHARAQRVSVSVHSSPRRVRVIVEDDGVGFDYHEALLAQSGQMGLIGMQERAQSIGGRIEVQSVPGQGTRLELEVPPPAEAVRDREAGPLRAPAEDHLPW